MAENVHSGHRQRMYKKYDSSPFETFPEHEILEMLLFYVIPQRNTNDIAHKLLKRFGSIERVITTPTAELEGVENIGRAAARYLNMWGRTFERIKTAKPNIPKKLTQDNAESVFRSLFKGKTCEEVYMICLDPQNNILVCEKIAEGTFESSDMNPRSAAKIALNYDSANVIFAHNHPSGICEASQADINVTKMLEGAFSMMGIKVKDHIIYTDDRCVSIMNEYRIRRDRSLMPRAKRR